MNAPNTTREALIVEAIGDVGRLLQRVEALVPTMDASRTALLQACASLATTVGSVDERIDAACVQAQRQAVQHISDQTHAMARRSLDAQMRALQVAARTLFRDEAAPALQRIAEPLQRVAAMAREGAHPWQRWLTHAATATAAASLTWAMLTWSGCR